MGKDTIRTGTGTDTVIGDNGFVQLDAEGNNLAEIATKSQPSTTGPIHNRIGGRGSLLAVASAISSTLTRGSAPGPLHRISAHSNTTWHIQIATA